MSVNYASGLSKYENKGVCGTAEIFDEDDKLNSKIDILADMIKKSKFCVLYVGAGLSTSAGIPDFRGPNGVWTKEKEEEKRLKKSKTKKPLPGTIESSSTVETKTSINFDNCLPTFAHRAIRAMIKLDMIKFIVSQNVDGLFVKDGISRKYIAELHGNYFVDECSHCLERFTRNRPSPTMGCKSSNTKCPRKRPCRGILHDTILDWEQSLPEAELAASENASNQADLAICLGTTLQIEPAGSLPLRVKKNRKRKVKASKDQESIQNKNIKVENDCIEEKNIKLENVFDQESFQSDNDGKLVIINLQKTRFDSRADLLIHHYLDNVFEKLCQKLDITVPEYDPANDPTLSTSNDLKPFKR